MPAWLPPSARPWWPRVIGPIEPMGVLTHADEGALANMCILRAQLHEASKGKPTPAKSRLIATLTRVYQTYENRFGLTSADRARIVANPKEDVDQLDELRERRARKARQVK